MKNVLLALLMTSPVFAADYTDCAAHFLPFSAMKVGQAGPPGTSTPLGGLTLYPFTLSSEGKIEVARGVDEYSFDKEKNQEVIDYETPVVEMPEDWKMDEAPNFDKVKTSMKKMKITIQRDSDGNITTISQDTGLSQSDIDRHNRFLKSQYEKTYTPEARAMWEKWSKKSGIDPNIGILPFPSENRLNFSMVGGKDGKCRLDGGESVYVTDGKKDGKKTTVTNFDTKFCRDMTKLVEKHQQALKSCNSPDAENDVTKAVDRYMDRHPTSPLSSMPGMGMGMGMIPGPGSMIGGYGQSLDTQVMMMRSPGSGVPAIVKAQQMAIQCQATGNKAFMDDSYWPEAPAVKKAKKSKSTLSE